MQDLYLRFNSESQALGLLYQRRETIQTDAGPVSRWLETPIPLFKNIDMIGLIYEQTGTTIQDGQEVPVMQALPGWHANVRLLDDEDGSALEQFRVEPQNPRRVWA